MFISKDIGSEARGPFDDFWYYPVAGLRTPAGMRVSPDTALAVTAVFACCQVRAQTLAQVPLVLYKRLEDGGKQRAVDHPLYGLLTRRPNRWQTSYQWRQMCQWHLDLRGNAYNRLLFGRGGEITEMLPMHPDRMRMERIGGGEWRYRYRRQDGTEEVLVRGEVFHVRGLGASVDEPGLSPIDLERESIGEALAAQTFAARMLQNDARPNGVLEWTGSFKDDDERRRFRLSWQEAQTGAGRGKTAVLEKGMTWKDIGLSNEALQYIELRKLKENEMARIYRMPPHKIGILDRSTNNNIEHQGIEFVTDTMLPLCVNWEQECSAQLLLDGEQDEYFAEFLIDGLLRGDATARATFYSKGILDGWLTRNEVRIKENLNPLPGLEKPLEPMNMRRAGDRAGDKGSQGAGAADKRGQESAGRLAALEAAAVERVARKEAAMIAKAFALPAHQRKDALAAGYERHAEFVAQVLGIGRPAVETYCLARIEDALLVGDLGAEDLQDIAATKLQRLLTEGTP